jgi:ribosomal-protein-alanine N-acetyltransferase
MLKGRTGYAEPEIGYMIAKSRQSRGLATEAAGAVIQECRASNLERVWASIRPHNSASHWIAERLGMRLHRTEADDRGELHFYVIDLQPTASIC